MGIYNLAQQCKDSEDLKVQFLHAKQIAGLSASSNKAHPL